MLGLVESIKSGAVHKPRGFEDVSNAKKMRAFCLLLLESIARGRCLIKLPRYNCVVFSSNLLLPTHVYTTTHC